MTAVCVFCGSQAGLGPTFAEAARQLGRVLADRNDTLVYGGGSTGLMGAVADEMLARDGHVIGVIPEALAVVELMHTGVADMRVVPDMHVRKATMHELADAYIAMPGGFGTMEELFEVLCWAQLDFHSAPIALLNLNGYYDGLDELVQTMVGQRFLTETNSRLLTTVTDITELTQWLTQNAAATGNTESRT